jgi:hypothetical protein
MTFRVALSPSTDKGENLILPHKIEGGIVMTTTEQVWFLIAIGGFLVFFEGAISSVARTVLKGRISPDTLKVIAGLVIFVVGLIYLI